MGTIGAGNGGALGGLRISISGRASVGDRVHVGGNRVPPGTPVAISFGVAPSFVPLCGGTVFVAPLVRDSGVADARGVFRTSLDVPTTASAIGVELWAQALAFDPTAPQGVALSPGATAAIVGN